MEASSSFQPPRMSWFDAASGLLLTLFMGAGYIFGMKGFPSLGSAEEVVDFYRSRGSVDAGIGCVLVTIAFTTVFAAGLAFVLAPAMLIDKGTGADAIYLMHAASLLTGVTSLYFLIIRKRANEAKP